MTRYQPSTEYSLLNSDNDRIEVNSRGASNDKDEYSVLDRSNGRDRTKNRDIHLGEEVEGYSKLGY